MFKRFILIYSIIQILSFSMRLWAAEASLIEPARYYINTAEGKRVPVTHLDAVITKLAGKNSLHSFYDFAHLEAGEAEYTKFLSNYLANIECKKYESIDHLIVVFEVSGLKAAIINLENSTRSSEAGHPLHLRLEKIVDLINRAKNSGVQLFFFSEACRHSFPAGLKVSPSALGNEEKKWDEIRSALVNMCDLKLLEEEVNNTNNPGLPFGILAMVTTDAENLVIMSRAIQLLKEGGNGCIAISVTMSVKADQDVKSVTFVGMQLPLNFQLSEQAPYVKVLGALKEIYESNENMVIFGDFNTVSNEHYKIIKQVFPSVQFAKIPSFYAAYFDTLPEQENIAGWKRFEELNI